MIFTNKMTKLFTRCVLFGLFYMLSVPATVLSTDEDGGQPGVFTRIGVGARAMGMGRAFTAIADDASSAYWNPAGLGALTMTEVMGNVSILSMDRRYNYAAVAFPLKTMGTIGISWINLNVGEIEERNEWNQIGEIFSNSENGYYLSWGFPFNEMIHIGGSAKYLTHNLAGYHSTGFGFDAGILVEPFETLRVGASVHDLFTKVKWDTDSGFEETYPFAVRIGGAYSPVNYPVTVGFEMGQIQNQKYSYHAGIEAILIYGIGFRLGLDNGKFAAGGTVSVPWGKNAFQTDYSLSQDPIDHTYVYRVSVSFRLFRNGSAQQVERKQPEDLEGYLQLMTPPPDARIIRVTEQYPDYALINAGSNQGIVKDMVLSIYRLQNVEEGEGRIRIGSVTVVKVEDEASAVRTQWIMDGYALEVGDVLIYEKSQNPVSQVLPQFNR